MQMQKIWMAVMAVAMMVGSAQAFIVVEHAGANDPTSEGFNANGDAGLGSAVTDGGTAAWKVLDDQPTELSYGYALSAEESSAARNDGFTMRANVRLPIVGMPIQSNPFVHIRFDGDKRYFLRWGTENSGAVNVQLLGTGSNTQELGVTTDDYALYEVTYDGDTNEAQLYVNGSTVGNGVLPMIDGGTNIITWGSGASTGHPAGEGNFSLLNLDINNIPEPASLALIGFGGLALLARRR